MKQGDMKPDFEVVLENLNEEAPFITLRLFTPGSDSLNLDLQNARNLAYTLIQHVHLAEVRRSLKRSAEKQAY